MSWLCDSDGRRPGFTLIELLVVVSIVALLAGILLPALGNARQSAKAMTCLSNMRQMELAHAAYTVDNKGQLIHANLSHGGIVHYDDDGNPIIPWFNTLKTYYGDELVARSPLDTSPHWGPAPQGQAIPGAPSSQRRVTSYGINTFTDSYLVPWGPGFVSPPAFKGYTMDRIVQPTSVIHFMVMAYTGEFAGADHPHVDSWLVHPSPAFQAQKQAQINAVRGAAGTNDAVGNWGYLDGHAEAVRFGDLVKDIHQNKFDPANTF